MGKTSAGGARRNFRGSKSQWGSLFENKNLTFHPNIVETFEFESERQNFVTRSKTTK